MRRTRGSDMQTNRPTRLGTVKHVTPQKGFGFLADADGTEYFFHRSSAPDFDALTPGVAVTFVPTDGQKGPRAESVERA